MNKAQALSTAAADNKTARFTQVLLQEMTVQALSVCKHGTQNRFNCKYVACAGQHFIPRHLS